LVKNTLIVVVNFTHKKTMADEPSNDEIPQDQGSEPAESVPSQHDDNAGGGSSVTGSNALRPVFLGNLKPNYTSEDILDIFNKPITPPGAEPGTYKPVPVDRLDQKRGYCFVFLKDAVVQEDKDNAERFVAAISGM
jgi:RNA recognition motif-containing protein